MRYKHERLRGEFKLLHPKVKDLLDVLDLRLSKQGWPEVMLTEIKRSREQQRELYWQQTMRDLNCTEEIARKVAFDKPSWHLWWCAVDFSAKIYDKAQQDFILDYLEADNRKGNPVKRKGTKGSTSSQWECLRHDVGFGDHFHFAYKDYSYRQQWTRQQNA